MINTSQYSVRKTENIDGKIFIQSDLNAIMDVEVTKDDIITATVQLKENSAPRADGIPAIFLKKQRRQQQKLIMLLLRQSLDQNSIAEIHKVAYVSPLYRGSSELLLKQY